MLVIIPMEQEEEYNKLMEFVGWERFEIGGGRENTKKRYSKTAIPKDMRWIVWERDNFTCVFCGARRYLHIDHIKPESKGGKTVLSNLQTLCKQCNIKKGSKYERL
jgi:5-methylcytosine-specific restriction endonuclease McrA